MTEIAVKALQDTEKTIKGRLSPLYEEARQLESELVRVQQALAILQGTRPGRVSPLAKATMKELALKALPHFPNGATALQLLAFFASAWGRQDVFHRSFSPQLSRLKAAGKIRRDGHIWRLNTPEPPGETISRGL